MRCTDGGYGITKQDLYNAILVIDSMLQDVDNGRLPKHFDRWHIRHVNKYLLEYVNKYYDLLNPTK